MTPRQAMSRPILLGLVLAFFSLQAVFFALTLPAFQGPDEPVHYATVQRWAALARESAPHTPPETAPDDSRNPEDIRTFSLNTEITAAALLTRFDEIKWQPANTLPWSVGSVWGQGEHALIDARTDHTGASEKSGTSGTWSWHYWLGAQVENILIESDFFTRFFSLRLLSVLLGLSVVVTAWYYFIASGLGRPTVWIATLILAAQPMLLATSSIVNIDIALIAAFSLFALGSTKLIVAGPSRSAIGLTLAAAVLGITAKGPGIVLALLLVPLMPLALPRTIWKHFLRPGVLIGALILLGIGAWLFATSGYFQDITRSDQNSAFPSPIVSLSAYLERSLDPGQLSWSHTSFWGNFGWLDTPLPDWILEIILTLELIAVFGLMGYFRATAVPNYLPPKRAVNWALLMVTALQFAIRFFDWRVFDATGQILIGTPGRYFLPTLLPFILLIITGLGWLARDRAQFSYMLKWLATGALILALYSFWHVLIPRYYL